MVEAPSGGTSSSAVNLTITLDGDGKRRTMEDSSGFRRFVWDKENILAETDSGGSTTAAYTMTPEQYGSLVSQRRSGASSFHHFDALGSTGKLTDNNAAVEVEYMYRAFGEQTVVSGVSNNPFTWVGKAGYYRQPDSSDYWVRARVMRPEVGRFLTPDPIGSARNINLYAYVNNNPLNWIDPTGEKDVKIGGVKYEVSYVGEKHNSPFQGTHYTDKLTGKKYGVFNGELWELNKACQPIKFADITFAKKFYDAGFLPESKLFECRPIKAKIKGAAYIKGLGWVLIGVGIAGSGYKIYEVYKIGRAAEAGKETARQAGGWGGAYLGAEALGAGGAYVGTFICPGLGTAIGGGIGTVGGGILGWIGGEELVNQVIEDIENPAPGTPVSPIEAYANQELMKEMPGGPPIKRGPGHTDVYP
jgi:RHS repeat-associated protein